MQRRVAAPIGIANGTRGPHDLEQHFGLDVFVHHGKNSRTCGLGNVVVKIVGGGEYDPRSGAEPTHNGVSGHTLTRYETIHPRHVQIDEHDIGGLAPHDCQCPRTVTRLAHDHDVRL